MNACCTVVQFFFQESDDGDGFLPPKRHVSASYFHNGECPDSWDDY